MIEEGTYTEYECDHTPNDVLCLALPTDGATVTLRISTSETEIDPSCTAVVRLSDDDARDLARRILAALPSDSEDD